jgi:hypothetical protein
MMLGTMWGMFAAAQSYKIANPEILTSPAPAS